MREPDGPLEDRSTFCGAVVGVDPSGAWAVGDWGGTVSVRDLVCAMEPRGAKRTSESVSDGSRLRPRRLLAGRVWVNPELPDMSASLERAGVGGEYPVRVDAIVGVLVRGCSCRCVQLVELRLPWNCLDTSGAFAMETRKHDLKVRLITSKRVPCCQLLLLRRRLSGWLQAVVPLHWFARSTKIVLR